MFILTLSPGIVERLRAAVNPEQLIQTSATATGALIAAQKPHMGLLNLSPPLHGTNLLAITRALELGMLTRVDLRASACAASSTRSGSPPAGHVDKRPPPAPKRGNTQRRQGHRQERALQLSRSGGPRRRRRCYDPLSEQVVASPGPQGA